MKILRRIGELVWKNIPRIVITLVCLIHFAITDSIALTIAVLPIFLGVKLIGCLKDMKTEKRSPFYYKKWIREVDESKEYW